METIWSNADAALSHTSLDTTGVTSKFLSSLFM